MNLTDAAISLLLNLAEQGEIDPWDVQVIDVIDRFLAHLAPTACTQDLSESGQAFLYAAMLVYLKAMALGSPDPSESTALLPAEDLTSGDTPWQSPVPLETLIRPKTRITRTRPVTLRDLIEEMQHLETLLHPPEKPARPPRLSRHQALQAIRELSHPENLSENLQQLTGIVQQLSSSGSPVDFEVLVQHFAQGSPTTTHRVQVFWGLLLMSSRSQVDLHQEHFYGAIRVSPIPLARLVEAPA